MRNKQQKLNDIHSYLSRLTDDQKDNMLFALLEWQCVEIGEDVSVRYDEEDEYVVDIYWSSCGDSLCTH